MIDTPISKEEFNALPRSERRKIIAQDVLKHLASKKFISTQHDYFQFRDLKKSVLFLNKYDERFTNAKAFIEPKSVQCHVCAKGAAVCAYVLRFNKKSVGELRPRDEDLIEIFGEDFWDYIECLFEGWFIKEWFESRRESERSFPVGKKLSIQALIYYKGNLEALMRNIIKHNGSLVIGGKVLYK